MNKGTWYELFGVGDNLLLLKYGDDHVINGRYAVKRVPAHGDRPEVVQIQIPDTLSPQFVSKYSAPRVGVIYSEKYDYNDIIVQFRNGEGKHSPFAVKDDDPVDASHAKEFASRYVSIGKFGPDEFVKAFGLVEFVGEGEPVEQLRTAAIEKIAAAFLQYAREVGGRKK